MKHETFCRPFQWIHSFAVVCQVHNTYIIHVYTLKVVIYTCLQLSASCSTLVYTPARLRDTVHQRPFDVHLFVDLLVENNLKSTKKTTATTTS